MQEWTYRHHVARVNNAGVEISAPCVRGGQCRSGQSTTTDEGCAYESIRLSGPSPAGDR